MKLYAFYINFSLINNKIVKKNKSTTDKFHRQFYKQLMEKPEYIYRTDIHKTLALFPLIARDYVLDTLSKNNYIYYKYFRYKGTIIKILIHKYTFPMLRKKVLRNNMRRSKNYNYKISNLPMRKYNKKEISLKFNGKNEYVDKDFLIVYYKILDSNKEATKEFRSININKIILFFNKKGLLY